MWRARAAHTLAQLRHAMRTNGCRRWPKLRAYSTAVATAPGPCRARHGTSNSNSPGRSAAHAPTRGSQQGVRLVLDPRCANRLAGRARLCSFHLSTTTQPARSKWPLACSQRLVPRRYQRAGTGTNTPLETVSYQPNNDAEHSPTMMQNRTRGRRARMRSPDAQSWYTTQPVKTQSPQHIIHAKTG